MVRFYNPLHEIRSLHEIVWITLASLLATGADFVKSSHTRYARVLRLLTGLIGTPAFIHAGNWGGAIVDATTVGTMLKAIGENDFPVQDRNEKPLSRGQRVKAYLGQLFMAQTAHGESCKHREGRWRRIVCVLKHGAAPDSAVPGIPQAVASVPVAIQLATACPHGSVQGISQPAPP
ncbi:MAG: hypothetical protein M3O22_00570 [Pseudomonadota bacterium]|nr:hypothetical protein [Pseudomonadota bacterium]